MPIAARGSAALTGAFPSMHRSGSSVISHLDKALFFNLSSKQREGMMKCERCGAGMLEEYVAVSGDLVKVKNISAWHCTACKRVEYGTRAHGPVFEVDSTRVVSGSGFPELS
jgi:hypothetical protein